MWFHHGDVRDAHGLERRHAQGADRARPEDHDTVTGRDAGPGDAVQSHRQRLGQSGVTGGQALGEAQDAASPHRMYSANAPSVCSEVMLLRFSHCDGLPSRQRRHVPQRGGAPHDELADRPPRDVVADSGDRPAPFVACYGTRSEPPTVAQLMDVGPADAARVHAHDELVRPGSRHRPFFHRDHAGRLVDGRRHHLGKRVDRR